MGFACRARARTVELCDGIEGALTLVYLPGKEMLNVVLLEEGNDEKDF